MDIIERLDLPYRWAKLKERAIMRFVWSLPHEVIRWAICRATAHATMGQWGMDHPGEITAFTVMDRWESFQAKPIFSDQFWEVVFAISWVGAIFIFSLQASFYVAR